MKGGFWIILTEISRAYRNRKWNNRVGWTWTDTKVNRGKERWDISTTVNKISKELYVCGLLFCQTELTDLAHGELKNDRVRGGEYLVYNWCRTALDSFYGSRV
ncbi:Hypothetical protein CINCED_3A004456 [Cinara cedri]|uniref:Uncharacterized protein n=1 Tax=Cinara cedri TaxID=506608 RepID=A0A5E4MKR5_9HEMI|nr:Hypothetical protein CINCED_3A004456 [Cinara cedri]